MKEKKKIRISIHPVEDHPGDYLAYFRSEFLDATYTVFFKPIFYTLKCEISAP